MPNRPGVVAQLALELGRAGVNITDMALYPAADMSEGVVALWISGEAPPAAPPSLWAASASRWRGHERPLCAGHAPCGADRATGRQVDLPPGGDHRRDGVRAGTIANYLHAADTDSTLAAVAEVGAIVERRDGSVLVRGCGLRNAQPPRRRSTSATPAP